MRSLAILGLASFAMIGAAGAQTVRDSGGGRWGQVPTVPLNPPVARPVAPLPPVVAARPAPMPAAPPGGWTQQGWNGPPPPRPAGGNGSHGDMRHDGWRDTHGAGWRDDRPRGNYRFRQGYVLPSYWVQPRYVVNDWQGYGLGRPDRGRNWVRYYDDAYLVDGRGTIYDSAYDMDWGRYDRGDVPDYAGRDYPPDYDYRSGHGYDDGNRGGPYRMPHSYASVYQAAPGTTVVTIAPSVVTTTTTYETVSYVPTQKRSWKPKRRCACK